MRIAERITVRLAGEDIELHPSLGDAMRLERREGSFAKLFRDIAEGSLTAAADIIRPHAPLPLLETNILDAGIGTLQGALSRYVMACAGIDPDAPANDNASTSKPVPFGEHLKELYRIGTGWLGWTPAATLDATPLEIKEAYAGRLALLKAIFGSSEPEKTTRAFTDDNVRAALAGFSIIRAD